MSIRMGIAALVLTLVMVGCASPTDSPAAEESFSTTTATSPIPTTSTESAPTAPPENPLPEWATRRIYAADPATLETRGPGLPAGLWTEGAVVTEDVIAFATWPEEETARPDSRWRLVVADRQSGRVLTDERVGDLSVLDMFAGPTGEVLVVEPIRGLDPNSAGGLLIHGYDHRTDVLREVARFEGGDFAPWSSTQLTDGLIGISGRERNEQGIFDRMRIVVFDWMAGEVVTDVVLDHLPMLADGPKEAYLNDLLHAVVWDTARSRALVVHALEDVITTVSYPSGDIEVVPLVENASLVSALWSWLIPPAYAKGLPSSERHAVISADRLYVAGAHTTFGESETYRYAPTAMFAVDLESLRIVTRTEMPMGFLAASPQGGYLLGGARYESGHFSGRISGDEDPTPALYVIDPDTLDIVATHDLPIFSGYQLQTSPGGDVIYVDGGETPVRIFDPMTGVLEQTGTTVWDATLIEQGLRYRRVSR